VKYLVALLLILGLSACISAPKRIPFLALEPVEVELKELNNYWVESANSFSVDTTGLNPPKSGGYVKIRCLIDSNGEVFEAQVVDSQPQGGWEEFALRAIHSRKYSPSDKNLAKVPVYVVREFKFGFST
jgi:TonB family protein